MISKALSSVNDLLNENPLLLDRLQNGDDQLVKEIIDCWDNAAFSDMTDQSLRRYFSYEFQCYIHAIEICLNRQTLPKDLICRPIEHLRVFYHEVLEEKLIIPDFYSSFLHLKVKTKIDASLKQLAKSSNHGNVLKNFITSFGKSEFQLTFRSLGYFNKVIDAILEAGSSPDALLAQMVKINFNHIEYYVWQQQVFQEYLEKLNCPAERKAFLRDRILWLKSIPATIASGYDETFPCLKDLLLGWLDELLIAQNCEVSTATGEKLKIKLPASEFACFLFASTSQGWFDDRTLQSVFHFISVHFSSKHKENLSQKNLSKEYYSVTQQTVARTRERLQQMINAINKRYFPV